jgi:glycerol-3-phosphate O-acyltransferase
LEEESNNNKRTAHQNSSTPRTTSNSSIMNPHPHVMKSSFVVMIMVALLWSSTVAFTPAAIAPARSARTTFLDSSTIEPATTTTDAASASKRTVQPPHTKLQSDYQAALDGAIAKIQAGVPAKYKDSMAPLLTHFATEYLHANQAAGLAGRPDADATSAATRFVQGVVYGLTYGMTISPKHYKFDVSHVARRGTEVDAVELYGGIDFYEFGCSFFRSCMDLQSPDINVLNHESHLQQAVQQLRKGENVIFFANHQSEADPQVTSACFELAGYAKEAADMIYVAGHKVTTDPLAIPFSMGRNLICIHSKKHIDADPDTKPDKQRQNLKAMNALLSSLKGGGACIWVAPSGGRDRRNVETGEVPLAPFDSKTIDMFRLMGNKSKIPTHYYTLAMVSYDLCPPPDYVEAGVGESRNVRFSPVGIHVGAELISTGGLESRHKFCDDAMQQCQNDYDALKAALGV